MPERLGKKMEIKFKQVRGTDTYSWSPSDAKLDQSSKTNQETELSKNTNLMEA